MLTNIIIALAIVVIVAVCAVVSLRPSREN